MGALLVSPGNKIVDVDGSEVFIEWVATQPQSSFEVQYRLHKNSVWSTCGVYYEPYTRKYSVMNIYNLVGVDFYEVYYRVVITYNGTNGLGTIYGNETSDTYSLIFKHGIKGTLKLYDGIGTLEYPLYDSVSINSGNSSEVSISKISLNDNGTNIKLLPLLKGSNGSKSNLNVNVSNNDTRQVAYSYSNFTNSGSGSSYFEQTFIDRYEPTYGTSGTILTYAARTEYAVGPNYSQSFNYNYTPINSTYNIGYSFNYGVPFYTNILSGGSEAGIGYSNRRVEDTFYYAYNSYSYQYWNSGFKTVTTTTGAFVPRYSYSYSYYNKVSDSWSKGWQTYYDLEPTYSQYPLIGITYQTISQYITTNSFAVYYYTYYATKYMNTVRSQLKYGSQYVFTYTSVSNLYNHLYRYISNDTVYYYRAKVNNAYENKYAGLYNTGYGYRGYYINRQYSYISYYRDSYTSSRYVEDYISQLYYSIQPLYSNKTISYMENYNMNIEYNTVYTGSVLYYTSVNELLYSYTEAINYIAGYYNYISGSYAVERDTIYSYSNGSFGFTVNVAVAGDWVWQSGTFATIDTYDYAGYFINGSTVAGFYYYDAISSVTPSVPSLYTSLKNINYANIYYYPINRTAYASQFYHYLESENRSVSSYNTTGVTGYYNNGSYTYNYINGYYPVYAKSYSYQHI